MILSNTEIYRALDDGRIVLKPEPAPRTSTGVSNSPFNSSSVDLTLEAVVSLPRDGLSIMLDPAVGNMRDTIGMLYDHQQIPPSGFRLSKGQLALGQTRERVELPLVPDGQTQLAARVEGRSSMARCGLLVHFTAPTIHAGFSGTITLEMMNLGPTDILLTPGMRICQLIVEHVVGHPDRRDSMFQNQATPSGHPGTP